MLSLEKEIKEVCRFCDPPERGRILFESQNFYVMISLGQIVEGYLLIVSKSHIESCAQIPEDLFPEFLRVVEIVRAILLDHYGHSIFYEHGRSASCLKLSDGLGSKHCYHAHLHCVPIDLKMNEIIDSNLITLPLSGLQELPLLFSKMQLPYLFVDDGIQKIHFIEKEIRKQYLRYLVANHVSRPELWDWIGYPEWNTIQKTKIALQEKFMSYGKTD